MSAAAEPALAVVLVTHDNAGQVPRTLAALAPQLGAGDELVVVDSGSADGTPAIVRAAAPAARLLELDGNRGFTAGCNEGARSTTAPLLMFLNPDAVPAAGCLAALRRAAHDRPAWGAWQALVTLPGGQAINTSGGVTHFLGMGWAGRCGEPLASAPPDYAEVGFASGAALVVRRTAWERVGGFDERYFMYGEDLDLALRLWLAGLAVGIAPAARVDHEYEFAKGSRKWLLLERNRWWTILSDYPALLLALLAPALLAAELALLALAARGGWLGAKLRAQVAVLRELSAIRARRKQVQALRQVSATALALRLSDSLESPYLGGIAPNGALAALQRGYWTGVVAALGLLETGHLQAPVRS